MNEARARGTRRLGTALVAVFSVVLALGVVLVAGRGVAAWQDVSEPDENGRLHLRTNPFPAEWHELGAGDVVTWHVEASLHGAERSTLALELEASGTLVDAGMRVAVDGCTLEYLGRACPGESSAIVDDMALTDLPREADGRTWQLADLTEDAPRYLLITVSIPASPDRAGLEGRLGVGLHASGDDQGVPAAGAEPPGALAPTGGDLLALLVLAIGMLGVGSGALLRRRRRGEAGA
ncbi:hypothetical protein GCM10011490_15670 [Pseudoclavibacter endophyticus]|uniref:Uncharacterized protein n=1 Tax=Pseudoclavibacter endophyticus TaxID=1778590 RepID=A0A6H9WMS3_9MICO|nr:hypothetical protein [Pseudoclavibacter endophyticus]KAB1649051.1 hypothetical protein F8O04_01845 [Pseudoclavibacter endophyticus]GGA65880.1 hypothetical protein GCM10011490_15670 [Pseudoclavibacter endophyticus]